MARLVFRGEGARDGDVLEHGVRVEAKALGDRLEALGAEGALGVDDHALAVGAAVLLRGERAQGVLERRLWSEELQFFVTEAQPPPPNLHAELGKMRRLGRAREVQTYFGCLACHRRKEEGCPPWGGSFRMPSGLP